MYDARLGRWFCIDPKSEEYVSMSPFHFSGNNPLRFVDSNGMDYWSTSDPEQIRQFLSSYGVTGGLFDYKGWNHATDDEFLGNLRYNSKTDMYYYSWNILERNGNIVVNSKAFQRMFIPLDLGTIETYEPNWAGKFQKKMDELDANNTISIPSTDMMRAVYNFFNDISVTLKMLAGERYPVNFDRSIVLDNERVSKGVNGLLNGVGIGASFANAGQVVNVAQFNTRYKGTGITAATKGGDYINKLNNSIRQANPSMKSAADASWFTIPAPYISNFVNQ